MRYRVIFTDGTNVDMTVKGKAVKSIELIEDTSQIMEVKNEINTMDTYGGISADEAAKMISEGMKKIRDRMYEIKDGF